MGNPYLEVARTYAGKTPVVLHGLAFAGFLSILAVSGGSTHVIDRVTVGWIVMTYLLFLQSICEHAKQMLLDWRALLLPGFARCNLIVGFSISMLTCVITGTVVARATPATLQAAMAVSFASLALVAWTVWVFRRYQNAAFAVGFCVLGFLSASDLRSIAMAPQWGTAIRPSWWPCGLRDIAMDPQSAVPVGILLASWYALFLLVFRWIRFHNRQGEIGDFFAPDADMSGSSTEPREAAEPYRGPIERFWRPFRERRLEAILADSNRSPWFCVRRVRAAIGEPPLGLATMIMTMAVLLIGPQLFRSPGLREGADRMLFACVWLLPALLVFGQTIEGKSNLHRESTRPITRRRILLLQMSATLCEAVSAWLGLCGGILVVRWINDSSFVWRPGLGHQLGTIAGFFWLVTATMMFLLAAYQCLDAIVARIVCVIAASLLIIIAIAMGFELQTSTSYLWPGGVTALLSLILTIAAYELWLQADWD